MVSMNFCKPIHIIKLFIFLRINFTYSENPPPESNAITFLSVISFVFESTKYPEHSRPKI